MVKPTFVTWYPACLKYLILSIVISMLMYWSSQLSPAAHDHMFSCWDQFTDHSPAHILTPCQHSENYFIISTSVLPPLVLVNLLELINSCFSGETLSGEDARIQTTTFSYNSPITTLWDRSVKLFLFSPVDSHTSCLVKTHTSVNSSIVAIVHYSLWPFLAGIIQLGKFD